MTNRHERTHSVGSESESEEMMVRGALHSLELAYEIFSEQKDLLGFLRDFSSKQKDFCQRCTRVFVGEIPLVMVEDERIWCETDRT